MNILILGGTGFLGPAIVEELIARGHTPVLFNRGRTNPRLFPGIEKLQGDRNNNVKELEGRKFDAAIDTSGYTPGQLKLSSTALAGNVSQYVFISSVSVYRDFSKPDTDETFPVSPLPAGADVTRVTGETFGPLKYLSEVTAEEFFPGRTTVIRPGLIVGPRDNSDRFTYWPWRIDNAVGERARVLAPGSPDYSVQFIDVRDLAAFVVATIEQGHTGTYNAVGPASPMTMLELLLGIKATTTSEAKFVWAGDEFLLQNGVQPWMQMPMWVPARGEFAGFAQVKSDKAKSIGLTFRPLAETAQATLLFARALPPEHKWAAGINPKLEAELLEKLGGVQGS